MKSLYLIALLLAVSTTNAIRITKPLTEAQEARAIENAVIRRTVEKIDDETIHPKDGDHLAAIDVLKGIYHSNEKAVYTGHLDE